MPSIPDMVSLALARAEIWSAIAGNIYVREATALAIMIPAPAPDAIPRA